MSPIKGPVILIERQFTKPKFIGPVLRAISPNNSNKIRSHLTVTFAGNLFEKILQRCNPYLGQEHKGNRGRLMRVFQWTRPTAIPTKVEGQGQK